MSHPSVAAYETLTRRRETIMQNLAVRRSQEASKSEQRQAIEAELREAGVNPDDPEAEAARLTMEIEDHRKSLDGRLTEIEQLLAPAKVEATPPPKVEAVQEPQPTPAPQPQASTSADLDLD